jgi:hypothetical protein
MSGSPDLWNEYVAEATGFAIYGLDAPTGDLGAVFEELAQSGGTESDPIAWHVDEGVLQVTVRALRNVGARRDEMISQAVGWILGNTEAEDQMAKLRLTYRLAEAKVLIGLVAHPPFETPGDARFLELLRLTDETNGFLFNGSRFRDAGGTDLAWPASASQQTSRRRWRFLRHRSRRP